MGETRVRLGHDGRLTAIGDGVPPRLLQQPADYRVLDGPGRSFLLTRPAEDAREQLLMMGELVHRMTVVEIMNLLAASPWTGELHVAAPHGVRVLTLAQGALKHARTEIESERIGELLVRAGVLDRAALRGLLQQKPSDQRFGQLLVRRGVLDEELLYKHLQQQIEVIFYATMLVESGSYWFLSSPEQAAGLSTTVHLPVQGLLMEGVQRIDEMALYRERIPSNRCYPVPQASARRDGLDASMSAVFELCNGTRDVDELSRRSGLGDFLTLKAVYHLLGGGHVKLRRGPALDLVGTRRLVRQFNEIVRDIFVVVATYDSMERARRALSSWLNAGPHGKVLGDELDIDGTLDADKVVAKLERASSEDPMYDLHRALHELAAYALFIASNGLGRSEEHALSRDVNHRLNQLRP